MKKNKKTFPPFLKGKKAFEEGRLDNPYKEDRNFEGFREWERGFNTAYFDNLEKVRARERRVSQQEEAHPTK